MTIITRTPLRPATSEALTARPFIYVLYCYLKFTCTILSLTGWPLIIDYIPAIYTRCGYPHVIPFFAHSVGQLKRIRERCETARKPLSGRSSRRDLILMGCLTWRICRYHILNTHKHVMSSTCTVWCAHTLQPTRAQTIYL